MFLISPQDTVQFDKGSILVSNVDGLHSYKTGGSRQCAEFPSLNFQWQKKLPSRVSLSLALFNGMKKAIFYPGGGGGRFLPS